MRRLRKRVELDPHNPQYTVTVFGTGYQLQTGAGPLISGEIWLDVAPRRNTI